MIIDKSKCHMSKRWLFYFQKSSVCIFGQKTAAMVSYALTSCTEEPLCRWWWQEFLCQCQQWRNPRMFPQGSKIILTTNEGLRQVLVQLCIYAVTFISCRFICSWNVMIQIHLRCICRRCAGRSRRRLIVVTCVQLAMVNSSYLATGWRPLTEGHFPALVRLHGTVFLHFWETKRYPWTLLSVVSNVFCLLHTDTVHERIRDF